MQAILVATPASAAASRPGALATAGALALRVLNLLADADAHHRQARRLAELPAERLRDVGLTRAQALRQGAPDWSVPGHWLR